MRTARLEHKFYGSGCGRLFGFIVALMALWLAVGCKVKNQVVLGRAPKGDVQTVLAVRAGDTPPEVTLRGRMIEKCPVAGCWFRLRDSTGVIKVDTKSAGFVVVQVPLETEMTVAGKVVAEGAEVALNATGLRY